MSGNVWGFALTDPANVGVFKAGDIDGLFSTPEDMVMIDNGQVHIDIPKEVETIVLAATGWKPDHQLTLNVQPREDRSLDFLSQGECGFIDLQGVTVEGALVDGTGGTEPLRDYNNTNGTPPPTSSNEFTFVPDTTTDSVLVTFRYGAGEEWEIDRIS